MRYLTAFQHWEQDVLQGRKTRVLWTVLINTHFVADTPAASKAKLEAWAASHGIRLRWEPTTSRPGNRPNHWIYFTVVPTT